MSKSSNKAIENAEEVIERFGGIRPLASKIDVPVTTVQGWKKRNKIPAGRRTSIMEAAQEHNVDLSDLIPTGAANENQEKSSEENQKTEIHESKQVEETAGQSSAAVSAQRPAFANAPSQATPEMPANWQEMEKRIVNKSIMINGVLTGLAVIALLVLLWPSESVDPQDFEALKGEVNTLEGDVQGVKDEQSMFDGLIPKDIDLQIAGLRDQAAVAQAKLEEAAKQAEQISQDVLAQDAGTLEERLTKLEAHVVELTGSPFLAGMLERVEKWQGQRSGSRTLEESVSEISSVLSGIRGSSAEQINSALEAAREENDALSDTFEGVPSNELKAAALLLGMSQVRSSLNRDNAPFDDDLKLLQNLVGQNDPALNEALVKLAPKAKSGVLTPDGLNNEFRSLAGDIVVASLKGEDVSVQERAVARFNDLLQVEKDGELLTGTSTQATLLKTEYLLEQGDLESAISLMQSLEGPAAKTASPWIAEAQATLLAQQVQSFLGSSIAQRAYGASSVGSITARGGLGNSTLVHDEKTGIKFLERNKSPFGSQKGFKLGQ